MHGFQLHCSFRPFILLYSPYLVLTLADGAFKLMADEMVMLTGAASKPQSGITG